MAFQQSILLYQAIIGYTKTNAQLSIYLNTKIAINSTYAYYFSGTIILAITGTYAYFSLNLSIYLSLTVTSSAKI
jgi:hypothetical protein